jgi:hypothetical protein
MRIACFLMQKDEADLLDPWLVYHAHLFGAENLYVWDNGSTSTIVKDILRRWEDNLGCLNRELTTGMDFRKKGVILGQKIKDLDEHSPYDFYLPLDCDEFVVVEEEGRVSCEKKLIYRELERYKAEKRALGVQTAYYNLPGRKDLYWKAGHQKTFFRAGTFKQMDHGFHEGESKLEPGKAKTNIAYMHLHHKSHAQIVEHSRNKVAPYFDVTDLELMKTLYNTNRLVRFMLDDEVTYMERFTKLPGTALPEFREALERIGIQLPF